MKQKKDFFKFAFTLVCFFFFVNFISIKEELIYSSRINPLTINPSEKFLITAMHTGFDNTTNAYPRITDTLKFNGWHKYNSWFTNDTYNYSDTEYINSNVRSRVSLNNTKNLRTLFSRPIIDYASYGQQSDYQCENISVGADYWFYSYAN